ncbi:ABC transporter substrate-binding protein [Coprococcus sp. AF27-8]|nr:ABC transporter substrate-binding protein [Coprococcus sp. AF27-8]
MRKLTGVLLAGAMAVSLAACGQAEEKSNTSKKAETEQTKEQTPENVMIKSFNGNKEEVNLEVPYDPERIAVLDMASLDILDNLGMGDRVVGSASTSLEYLTDYVDNEEVANLGTIKETDLEAVMECDPDVIFIGGRLASSYDALSEIAPVVFLSTESELGIVKSVTKNAETIASMFGLEDEVSKKTEGFDERIKALKKTAEGKTALVGMTTSGSFNLMGNDGRCSIVGREVGFENLTAAESTSTHGNEASFETVVEKNPDYIFVMDRDSAIGADGAQTAKEIVENELVMGTDAYKNGRIIYLEHPAVWYTAEGGITALNIMLSDLENAL